MKHDDYRGLQVQLQVAGQPMQEYAQEEVNAEDIVNNVAACYVEATNGTEFSIYAECSDEWQEDPTDCLEVSVYLDGKWATARVLCAQSGRFSYNMTGVHSNTASGSMVRKFAFANLSTNDSPVDDKKAKMYKEIGQVRVSCRFVRKTSASYVSNSDWESGDDTGTVPEKALKGRAISSQVKLGTPIASQSMVRMLVVDYPYGEDPFATFKFKYRSRRDLQIEGIIPRSASPVPLDERDPTTLTHEEAIELLKRRNHEREDLIRVKREKRERSAATNDEDDHGDEIEIIEDRSKRRRTSDDSGVEVIDLTDD